MSLRVKLALTIVVATVPLFFALSWLRAELEEQEYAGRVETYVSWIMDTFGASEELARAPETWGGWVVPGRRGRGSEFDRGRGTSRRPSGRRGAPERSRNRIFPRQFRRIRLPPRAPLSRATIWAYDADLLSKNSGAPPFPIALRERVQNDSATVLIAPAPPREPAKPPSEKNAPIENGQAAEEPERPTRDPRGRRSERPGPPPWTDDQRERYHCAVRLTGDDPPATWLVLEGDRRQRSYVYWWMPLALAGALVLTMLFAAGPIVGRIRHLTEEVKEATAQHYEVQVTTSGNDEIGRLATAFNQAGADVRTQIETLKQRERTLRSFISNTTHDVMIPLTVLQGHLDEFRRHCENSKGLDPKTLASALDEAHYMGSILHNLSAVAKLEGADMEVRRDRVDLSAVVERAVTRHRPIASARDIGIDFAVPEEPVTVIGDVTLLEQALSNVVHNAVRYNEDGGHVAAVLEQRADGTFSVCVIDDGPGIPEEELAKLPERRFRGEAARTRDPNGLGLGLHIARDVAARHGFELLFRRSEYGGLEVELAGTVAAAV